MAVGNVMPWRGYPSSTNLAQRCGQRLSTLPPYHQLLTQVRNREDRYEIQYTGLSVGGAATPWHTRGLDQAHPLRQRTTHHDVTAAKWSRPIYTSLFRQPAAQANKKKINSQ